MKNKIIFSVAISTQGAMTVSHQLSRLKTTIIILMKNSKIVLLVGFLAIWGNAKAQSNDPCCPSGQDCSGKVTPDGGWCFYVEESRKNGEAPSAYAVCMCEGKGDAKNESLKTDELEAAAKSLNEGKEIMKKAEALRAKAYSDLNPDLIYESAQLFSNAEQNFKRSLNQYNLYFISNNLPQHVEHQRRLSHLISSCADHAQREKQYKKEIEAKKKGVKELHLIAGNVVDPIVLQEGEELSDADFWVLGNTTPGNSCLEITLNGKKVNFNNYVYRKAVLILGIQMGKAYADIESSYFYKFEGFFPKNLSDENIKKYFVTYITEGMGSWKETGKIDYSGGFLLVNYEDILNRANRLFEKNNNTVLPSYSLFEMYETKDDFFNIFYNLLNEHKVQKIETGTNVFGSIDLLRNYFLKGSYASISYTNTQDCVVPYSLVLQDSDNYVNYMVNKENITAVSSMMNCDPRFKKVRDDWGWNCKANDKQALDNYFLRLVVGLLHFESIKQNFNY